MAEFSYYLGWIILVIGSASGTITRVPETTVVTPGSTVTLRCQTDVTDVANPVEWHFVSRQSRVPFVIVFKAGMILNDFRGKMTVERNVSTGSYDLVIANVSSTDAGVYACIDDDSQHNAELIIIDRYPSDDFCSMTRNPDCILGRNQCSIDPDLVQLSCQLRYHGNSDLYLEWSNGGQVIASNSSSSNGTITSRIQFRADKLMSSENFSCSIKHKSEKISSKFVWTRSVNVTTMVDSTNVTKGDCNLLATTCSSPDLANRKCDFAWTDVNEAVLFRGRQLDLSDLPSGNYSCIAICGIRQTTCSILVQKLEYSCKTKASSPPSPVLLASIFAVAAVLVIVIVIFLIKRRRRSFGKATISGNDEEGRRLNDEANSSRLPEEPSSL